MDDFNSRNNLDYKRDPLDSKNLTGVHWNDAMRKVEPPPLFSNTGNYEGNKRDFSLNPFTFIAFLFIGFLCFLGLGWLYRLFYAVFFG